MVRTGTLMELSLRDVTPVLQILNDLGAKTTREGGALLRVDVPIPNDPQTLPDTPTDMVLKAVARQVLPPMGFRSGGAGSPLDF